MRARTQSADTRTDKARTNANGYARIYERGRTDRPAHPSATPQGQTRTDGDARRQADGRTHERTATPARTWADVPTDGNGRRRTDTDARQDARGRPPTRPPVLGGSFPVPQFSARFSALLARARKRAKKKNAPQGVPTVALGLLDQSALVHPLGRLARQVGVTDGILKCAVLGIPAVEKEHGNAVCQSNVGLHSLRVTCARPQS